MHKETEYVNTAAIPGFWENKQTNKTLNVDSIPRVLDCLHKQFREYGIFDSYAIQKYKTLKITEPLATNGTFFPRGLQKSKTISKLLKKSLLICLWTILDTLGHTLNSYRYFNLIVNSSHTLSLWNDAFKNKPNG